MKIYDNTTVNERLTMLLRKLKGMDCIHNDAAFAKKIGVSRSFLSDMKSGTKAISEQTILNILSHFNNINKVWLITGEGEMLKSSDSPISQPQKSHSIEDNSTQQPLDAILTYLQAENKELKTETKELKAEINSLNKQIGRLEGKLESAYELMDDLKKEIPAPGLFRAAK